MQLEIAVASALGARTAAEGGADRVELCTVLELGGITPSQGLVERTLEAGLPVSVLVRCRPGDFVYSDDEVDTMVAEARAVVRAGAAGVVVGALTGTGDLDREATLKVAEAARQVNPDCTVTFHRAIDTVADPLRVFQSLLDSEFRFDRVLTSGTAERAADGIDTIRRLAALAPAGLELLIGGGVTVSAIGQLIAAGAGGIHLSAKVPVHNTDDERYQTDLDTVRAARSAVDAAMTGTLSTSDVELSHGWDERRSTPKSTRTAVIASTSGLHARPAALFVQAVAATGLPITVAKAGSDPVDAHSILLVMALGAKYGETVTLTAEGEGAAEALDSLVELLGRDLDAE